MPRYIKLHTHTYERTHIYKAIIVLPWQCSQVGVERCIGRDIKIEQLDSMISTLENWLVIEEKSSN